MGPCFPLVTEVDLYTFRHELGLCEIQPKAQESTSSQNLLFLCIVSARAILREALSRFLYSSSNQWQQLQKLICQLCPSRNQPKGYWLHKQIILFLSRVTVYSGSQILLHIRTTRGAFKNSNARLHPYHLNMNLWEWAQAPVFSPVISMCRQV